MVFLPFYFLKIISVNKFSEKRGSAGRQNYSYHYIQRGQFCLILSFLLHPHYQHQQLMHLLQSSV